MQRWQEDSANETRAIQAHEELLGTFIANTQSFAEYAHLLETEMFYSYMWVYEVLRRVESEEGLSYRGIINRCETHQIKTIQTLRQTAINERRIPTLIQKAKEDLLGDRLRGIGRHLIDSAEEPDDVLRELKTRVDELETTESTTLSNPVNDLDEYAAHMMEIVADPSKAYGLMTGLDELDRITLGFQRKDFSVVGARTSMGKSAFMLQICILLHFAGYKVGIFSLEMSKRQLYDRIMANILNIALETYRTGQAHPSYYDKMKEVKNKLYGLYVDDTRGVNSEYIADAMKRLKRTQGLDFVVVDYIQDVAEKGEQNDNQGSALGRICRKLRKAAKDCDCHVMGLSQVTRAAEGKEDKRPGNSDLAGSTGIETSADAIALLYREDYYKPDTDKKNILEVNFTKQRNGKTGKVELYYDRVTQRISSIRGY